MKTIILSLLLFTNVDAVAVLPEEVLVPKRKVCTRSNKYHR